jgi:hypothetical protein
VGNTAIAAKGTAQHMPFKAFAPTVQLVLFFILLPIEDITIRNLLDITPKVIPKLAIKMMM